MISSSFKFGRRRELPHDDGETTPLLHLLEDVTSVWTTIVAIVHALWLMIRIRPQVILCNGPGTCIPLCVIAFLFKVLGIRWSSIFYVESVARVKKLSLSGLLLYNLRMADQFFVQWPQLQKNYPRAHYVGCLM
ncbi:hypothetical protein F2Q68_00037121 [Brassica cretica]|uniref:UDP-N-acetylglucosamine transferase subunit ALG14 n=1 Tax=Brassica cretica TaxID=69181 RepID=A0A8S9H146_BRACR|nr:hypothetical protein F2Q68_00037121 [Brassica cretica]